ncbi:hypothetical protein ABT173_45835 [Streptomyces sp. NPDC001795]|uniref:hypothetical protein n=1 Tax=Streptomyces sp. NPDC001795 TaxID=3154525 RepID=UPI00331FDC35
MWRNVNARPKDWPLSVQTTAQGVDVNHPAGHVLAITGVARDTDGLYTVSADGVGIVSVLDGSLSDFLNSEGPFASLPRPTPTPLARTVCELDPTEGIRVPDTVRALGARQAALKGQEHRVAAFTFDVLGLRHGQQWQEAVSTALLGDWTGSLRTEGVLGADALSRLKTEIRLIHRQLRPLWERQAHGSPVLLLDTPLTSDGMTLHDLVASTVHLAHPQTDWEPDDRRLANVLRALLPLERAVALAWAQPWVSSWEEAAQQVVEDWGIEDPWALGERVRRKLKRIGALHTAHATAAAAR